MILVDYATRNTERGFKLTEAGKIPEDWTVKLLPEVVNITNGKAHERFIVDHGQYIVVNSKFISTEGRVRKYTNRNFCPANRGSILMVMSDLPNGKALAKCFLVDASDRYAINQRVCSFTSKKDVPGYLFYLLNRNPYFLQFDDGVQQTHLLINVFKKCPIVVPPTVVEQSAIATSLSDVDALINSLDRLIAKKRDLKQAAMQELLTGKRRLPGFSGEWRLRTLCQIGDISGAGVDKKIHPGEILVRLVNYLDVYRRNFIYSKDLNHTVSAPAEQATRCSVKKGDIFFTPSSEVPNDIGISAVAMEDIPDAAYSYHVVRLRLAEDWDLGYRAYAFKSRYFLEQAERLCEGSGIRYVITQARFRQLTVLVPPTVQEQTAIGEVLYDMDLEIETFEEKRKKTIALKQGIMQELLTGRIRLVEPSEQ